MRCGPVQDIGIKRTIADPAWARSKKLLVTNLGATKTGRETSWVVESWLMVPFMGTTAIPGDSDRDGVNEVYT